MPIQIGYCIHGKAGRQECGRIKVVVTLGGCRIVNLAPAAAGSLPADSLRARRPSTAPA